MLVWPAPCWNLSLTGWSLLPFASSATWCRAQEFTFDGSVSIFRQKIFPHEFMHNYGTGHAWCARSSSLHSERPRLAQGPVWPQWGKYRVVVQ